MDKDFHMQGKANRRNVLNKVTQAPPKNAQSSRCFWKGDRSVRSRSRFLPRLWVMSRWGIPLVVLGIQILCRGFWWSSRGPCSKTSLSNIVRKISAKRAEKVRFVPVCARPDSTPGRRVSVWSGGIQWRDITSAEERSQPLYRNDWE